MTNLPPETIERIKARKYECFIEDHEPLPWTPGRCADYAGRGVHLMRCKRKDGHGMGGLFCRQHAEHYPRSNKRVTAGLFTLELPPNGVAVLYEADEGGNDHQLPGGVGYLDALVQFAGEVIRLNAMIEARGFDYRCDCCDNGLQAEWDFCPWCGKIQREEPSGPCLSGCHTQELGVDGL